MDLRFHLRLRNRDAALAEAEALTDPDSPRYGRFLTTEQFRARYAPTPEDAAVVRTWIETQGLAWDYEAGNRLIVAAHGTVAQVEAAFGTRIGRYRVRGTTLRAPMTGTTVPTALSSVVTSVGGLDDGGASMEPMIARRGGLQITGSARGRGDARAVIEGPPGIWTAPPAPGFRLPPGCSPYWGGATYPDVLPYGTSGPTLTAVCGYPPPVLRRAYNLREHDKLDGRGVTVALVEAFAPQPALLSDAQRYAERNDPEHPFGPEQLEIVMAPGADPASPPREAEMQTWYIEDALDVEAVHAIAPAAKILLVFTKTAPATNPAVEALNHIVDNSLATIVSNSYADTEFFPVEDYAAWEAVAIQANLKGIGLYFASGDHGHWDFGAGPLAAFPASLPQVTAVGGTSLAIDKKGRRLFEVSWQTTWSQLSAGGSLLDGVWEPPFPGAFLGGGGGGRSGIYAQPAYQEGVVPEGLARAGNALWRVLPDVSMLGAPDTGMLEGITSTWPDGVYYDEWQQGGTSLSAPLLAGLVALAEQRRGSPVGFINPTLYRMRRKLVRDIVPQAIAPYILPLYANSADASGGVQWWGVQIASEVQTLHTTKGYDNTTGLGAPRTRAFIRQLGRR